LITSFFNKLDNKFEMFIQKKRRNFESKFNKACLEFQQGSPSINLVKKKRFNQWHNKNE
jgi:hypothetical protein